MGVMIIAKGFQRLFMVFMRRIGEDFQLLGSEGLAVHSFQSSRRGLMSARLPAVKAQPRYRRTLRDGLRQATARSGEAVGSSGYTRR